jgi:hypothetical protein
MKNCRAAGLRGIGLLFLSKRHPDGLLRQAGSATVMSGMLFSLQVSGGATPPRGDCQDLDLDLPVLNSILNLLKGARHKTSFRCLRCQRQCSLSTCWILLVGRENWEWTGYTGRIHNHWVEQLAWKGLFSL